MVRAGAVRIPRAFKGIALVIKAVVVGRAVRVREALVNRSLAKGRDNSRGYAGGIKRGEMKES